MLVYSSRSGLPGVFDIVYAESHISLTHISLSCLHKWTGKWWLCNLSEMTISNMTFLPITRAYTLNHTEIYDDSTKKDFETSRSLWPSELTSKLSLKRQTDWKAVIVCCTNTQSSKWIRVVQLSPVLSSSSNMISCTVLRYNGQSKITWCIVALQSIF